MSLRSLAFLPGVVDPDPGTARGWLREELSRSAYQESALQRFDRWFHELLDRLTGTAGSFGGLSPAVGVVVLVVLVALAVLLLSRLGANPALPAGSAPVFTEVRDTATTHRQRAAGAVTDGRWDDAVLESVRALAATLFERGLVPERAGVTVHEITGTAADLFPGDRERLGQVGRTFDETRYGDRAADEAQARAAVALEADLSRAAPTRSGSTRPTEAVPR